MPRTGKFVWIPSHGKQLDWAAERDLRETQLRISVGLEKAEDLVQTFKDALVFADAVKAEESAVSVT